MIEEPLALLARRWTVGRARAFLRSSGMLPCELVTVLASVGLVIGGLTPKRTRG